MSSDPSSTSRKSRAEVESNLRKLGKYQIERKLGVGGMGTVFQAVDTGLRRTVALKVLPKDRAQNPILVRRFKSEGQAAALLTHKNIVSVYEAGEIGGYLFLALEYIEGMDVLEWMGRRGVISPNRSMQIIRQVAEALQHAFERNIVHRDIKPSNLMIAQDGTIKLTDMGLARCIDDTLDSKITRDGTTVGTVDYMAPEQAANSRSADIRSDLYSLGCTWYHMLAGSPPYPEGSVTNKLTAHLTNPLPDPRSVNPRVPEAMVAVIHRLMAKKPEDRYQTPAELLEDLDREVLRQGGQVDLMSMFEEDDPSLPHHVFHLDGDSSSASPLAGQAVSTVEISAANKNNLARGDAQPARKMPLKRVPDGENYAPSSQLYSWQDWRKILVVAAIVLVLILVGGIITVALTSKPPEPFVSPYSSAPHEAEDHAPAATESEAPSAE